jgi:hypothetical protein
MILQQLFVVVSYKLQYARMKKGSNIVTFFKRIDIITGMGERLKTLLILPYQL